MTAASGDKSEEHIPCMWAYLTVKLCSPINVTSHIQGVDGQFRILFGIPWKAEMRERKNPGVVSTS
jgi:hypothetical protein